MPQRPQCYSSARWLSDIGGHWFSSSTTPRDIDLVLHEEKLGDVFQRDYDNLSSGERVMPRRLAQGDADKVQLARQMGLVVLATRCSGVGCAVD